MLLAVALFLAPVGVSAEEGASSPDSQGSSDEAPRDTLDDPMRGAAISPARGGGDSGVKVSGNLRDNQRWTLEFGGLIRTRYTHIQADPQHQLFGRNDGFTLSDARFITRGTLDSNLGFVLSFDAGSRIVRTTPDSPVDRLAARMTDTYLFYSPFEFLELSAGQFKAPFDLEDLISTSSLLFVNRSVTNRGVQGVEGFNVEGLSQDRQIGVRAQGQIFFLSEDNEAEGPGVGYGLAIANGNGPNVSMNNNNRLAYYSRLSLHWGEMVSIGGGLFHNDSTLGDPPSQVDRLRWGWTADLLVSAYNATLFANIVSRQQETPELPQDPEVQSMGFQVQVAYEEPFFGFQPTYRFAYYNPDSELADRALTHHTMGLNYNAANLPLRLMANYTIALEEEALQMDNNRLDLLLQLTW